MNDLQRLTEMGITVWDLRRPSLFERTPQPFSLPIECKLLFVSNAKPNEQEAWLFGKILGSMQLLPNQALHIPYSALSNLHTHALQWCWFSEGEPVLMDGVKNLVSPSLSTLLEDINAKKVLWKQIKQASEYSPFHGISDQRTTA